MNAKEEFEMFIADKPPVVAVDIEMEEFKSSFREGDNLNEFIRLLDFEYDCDYGYGLQNLFGTIWFDDGTWATRGEYDGYEWWEYHKRPEIPDLTMVE